MEKRGNRARWISHVHEGRGRAGAGGAGVTPALDRGAELGAGLTPAAGRQDGEHPSVAHTATASMARAAVVGLHRFWHLRLFLLGALGALAGAQEQSLHVCKESEYHYEYTECNSFGSRWRVAVPHSVGLCTGLPDPVQGKECSFSCKAGEFLDMKEQTCKPCAEGTYSLGTGVRFDDWDELPKGFTNIATNLETEAGFNSVENCTTSTWVAHGKYIASNTDECTATLMYAINLKQPGTVSFEYYYPDSSIAFEFYVQNDQCQPNEEESRWMKVTEKGWEYHNVDLTRGNNVLYWKTTAFSLGSQAPKPVMLRNIGITGVAYTSECFPCKAGSYSSKSGSSFCKLCPANTYSNKGATVCQECEPDKYAEIGSESCKPRPPCTDKDYFYTHTPCDTNGQTQLMYKWIEPKTCNEDAEDAVQLPTSGTKTQCPPCNPGFFQSNTSTCEPCPYGSYSNGSTCSNCPVGTEPTLGFEYKWWNTLPANMETTVLSGLNFEYKQIAGWEVAGDYIYTVAGSSDNDFMILTLAIPGFSPPPSVTQDLENKEISRITFVFETTCTVSCELYFMMGMNSRPNSVVEKWIGHKGKQSYSYGIEQNATTTFTWAFQRAAFRESGRKYNNDVAKIYSINVTNVMDGVASYCRPCALESSDSGSSCTSCPPGHYIEKSTSACYPCPAYTYLKAHQPYGKQACVTCGPGTRSNEGNSLCYNDCQFSYSEDGRVFRYDFSALANSTTFTSRPSFTSKGLKYFHQFSIAICGNQGKKIAICVDNVTDLQRSDGDSVFSKSVTSYGCQSILLLSDMMGYKSAVLSQPISLADHLIGVTTDLTMDNITSPADYFPLENVGLPDLTFFFRSKEVTQSCSSGRATTIRLRCELSKVGSGTISVPDKCPEGTCDGCTFHFLWETAEACPLCSDEDYHTIVSACLHGIQKTTYVWREPRLCKGNVLPEQTVSICKSMDFWLKVGISAGTCAAALLTVMTCYFWKKNQKLEYKYSKLVMNTTTKDGDLPAADSCAIMEGEDVEDDLIFTSRKSLFGKIKAFKTKAARRFSVLEEYLAASHH